MEEPCDIVRRVSRAFLLSLFLLAGISLIGCSTSSSPQSSASAEKGTGISANLQKRPGGPLWNLESFGPVSSPGENRSFDLPAHGKIEIGGWAVDQEAKTAAGGVEIVIDGAPFAAQYGNSRPDVASAYGVPTYTNVGYSLALTGEQFAPGSHTAFVRVLSSDRHGYWEAGPYTFNFK